MSCLLRDIDKTGARIEVTHTETREAMGSVWQENGAVPNVALFILRFALLSVHAFSPFSPGSGRSIGSFEWRPDASVARRPKPDLSICSTASAVVMWALSSLAHQRRAGMPAPEQQATIGALHVTNPRKCGLPPSFFELQAARQVSFARRLSSDRENTGSDMCLDSVSGQQHLDGHSTTQPKRKARQDDNQAGDGARSPKEGMSKQVWVQRKASGWLAGCLFRSSLQPHPQKYWISSVVPGPNSSDSCHPTTGPSIPPKT
ncbi:hypothetical protein CH63R_07830 [Colletotrichum higginsianum IMI 349063]|uniref:Uncharacterized protein n=1 Tax=Colletotrichum higginsianum (strain IMI 349063) TaxID=759273 RepID=A0A1B7YAS8_COLHI|nr:hypothetical protein CH63R_07830 [Colletotrichum higginsianum IMI 349063]OBR09065.1 hypothetical protein CH63R_07830 [Colletotrichum higginsianum IMI 349063]